MDIFKEKVLCAQLFVVAFSLLLSACIHIPPEPEIELSSKDQAIESDAACLALPAVLDSASMPVDLPVTALPKAVWSRGFSQDSISVMSWNIYKESRNDWQQDFRQLIQGRDLVLLQEAFLNAPLLKELSDMQGEGGDRYRWAMTHAFYKNGIPSGVLTASRQKALTHCAQTVVEPIIMIPKSLLVSHYPVIGTTQTLLVANVHGINFTTGTDSYHQQFDALAAVLSAHDGPVMLAGDFNSWSQARMDILNDLARSQSLQRVAYRSLNRTTVFSRSIDHIYYRGMTVIQASSPAVETSDHNPLLVTFSVETDDAI